MQGFSKKLSTGERSVFGAVFITMKQSIDALRGLRYKLRMMGILIFSSSYIYGHNMSVVHNIFSPESVLGKENNLVCYHAGHESVAFGESLVGSISSKENIEDSMTKVLYKQKRRYLVSNFLYDIHDDN